MKKCTKCNIERELIEFSKQKKGKNGYVSWCKHCYKQYNFDNREKQYLKNKQLLSGAGMIITELGDKFMLIKWERFKD